MSNNNLSALNDILFDQLRRLNKDDVTGEALDEEISRSTAINNTGRSIIRTADLALRAEKTKAEYGEGKLHLSGALEHKDTEE